MLWRYETHRTTFNKELTISIFVCAIETYNDSLRVPSIWDAHRLCLQGWVGERLSRVESYEEGRIVVQEIVLLVNKAHAEVFRGSMTILHRAGANTEQEAIVQDRSVNSLVDDQISCQGHAYSGHPYCCNTIDTAPQTRVGQINGMQPSFFVFHQDQWDGIANSV